MKHKSLYIAAALAVSAISAAGAKKVLDHSSFDDWKSVSNYSLSKDGRWAAYAVNPQEGDGILYFYNTRTNRSIAIDRGYKPSFTNDGRYALALIKPHFADTRQAKIDKKKDFDLPQDSLAIINLVNGKVEKIADVTSYKIGEKGGDWVTYMSCDTTLVNPKVLKDKKAGRPMVMRHLSSNVRKVINRVGEYTMSRDGSKVAFRLKKNEKDSASFDAMGAVFLPDTSYVLIDRDKPYYGSPVFDTDGMQLAFTASEDTLDSGTKNCKVYLSELGNPLHSLRMFDLDMKGHDDRMLRPNQYTSPRFSYDGKRLVAGVGEIIAPDDTTIVDFEKATLDIWVYDYAYTPPQLNINLNEFKKNTYPVVINLADGHKQLITDNWLADVKAPNRWDGDWALVCDPSREIVSHQWDYFAPVDLQVVNVNTGETRMAGVSTRDEGALSPGGRYVYWYKDKQYHTYDVVSGQSYDITADFPVEIFDASDDHPSAKPGYGVAGWTAGDERILIYDKFDIWAVDPTDRAEPVCITAGEGRKRGIRFRYINTDPSEIRFVSPDQEMLLKVFDYAEKYNGLATLRYTGRPVAPTVAVLDGYDYTQVRKASDAAEYTWQRANFSTSPDIWGCHGTQFAKARRLTDANPQMKDYSWGTAQLVRWTAYDGKESEGVLYLPEDFDPDKKYPMLAVFYETGSEDLYVHYTMQPSWSWVNYPFYVSRGYVVFVPDIHYTPGFPGESCYNYVCSGVEEMCRRYPQIDKTKIGIDGQSWGGYQTAFLVTRTNMFAAAGSGAPVANMTSAFGGIRWESGSSRQGQYEQGQSRIGRNLWEAPELYIANSPVFNADKVTTPLLIMHNDNDGAVPWYQGIEMFMALRRLGKPVWMLQYNNEAHNLKERRNRKDITIRLQQFFDHFLKGDPEPRWMKEGIPLLRKGQEWGYEFIEQ